MNVLFILNNNYKDYVKEGAILEVALGEDLTANRQPIRCRVIEGYVNNSLLRKKRRSKKSIYNYQSISGGGFNEYMQQVLSNNSTGGLYTGISNQETPTEETSSIEEFLNAEISSMDNDNPVGVKEPKKELEDEFFFITEKDKFYISIPVSYLEEYHMENKYIKKATIVDSELSSKLFGYGKLKKKLVGSNYSAKEIKIKKNHQCSLDGKIRDIYEVYNEKLNKWLKFAKEDISIIFNNMPLDKTIINDCFVKVVNNKDNNLSKEDIFLVVQLNLNKNFNNLSWALISNKENNKFKVYLNHIKRIYPNEEEITKFKNRK
jgi:hypothetical protein